MARAQRVGTGDCGSSKKEASGRSSDGQSDHEPTKPVGSRRRYYIKKGCPSQRKRKKLAVWCGNCWKENFGRKATNTKDSYQERTIIQ
jgi:hypothetical protein